MNKKNTIENTTLTYDNQLEFKRWALKELHTRRDLFYFDSIYGVDGDTQRNINGLQADGSMNWKKGLTVLKRHFNKA